MVIKQSILFLFFLLFLTIFSCKKNEPPYVYNCQDGFIEFQNVTSVKFKDIGSLNDTLATFVIRSEDELNSRFSNTGSKFDFTKNTILAGRYKAPNVDKIISQSLKSFCAYNVFYYDIQLQSGMVPTSVKVPFFVLIPKIPDDATVQFKVHY